ncbi:MAG: hypothetical protein ABIJ18_02425 [archaeon]
MDVEHYFLRYAFPCAEGKVRRGEITSDDLKRLEDCVLNYKPVSRSELERIFSTAVNRLRKSMGDDFWNFEAIRKYFHEIHNDEINNGVGMYKDAPEQLRDLSRVYRARVIEEKDRFVKVDYEKAFRWVSKDMIPDLKVGDEVYIHFFYAVEKC